MSKETPIAFEWPDVDLAAGDQRFADLQALLRRLTYFGRAESWCEATVQTARPVLVKPNETHWCCVTADPGVNPSGREYVDYTLERKLAPDWPLTAELECPSLAAEAARLLTRIKVAEGAEDFVRVETNEILGDFPMNAFAGRLEIRPVLAKKKEAAIDEHTDESASGPKGKSKPKPWLLVAIGPWEDAEKDALLKHPTLQGEHMKRAKTVLSHVLGKRAEATKESRAWTDELARNAQTSDGGLLLLRCLLRSTGDDIEAGLERPVGSRWIYYRVPRAIYRLPSKTPRRAAGPQVDTPGTTLMRFALNTASVNRPVLPSIRDTLLIADKFRSAALAWHGRLFDKQTDPKPRNLCGREDDGSIVQSRHDHAYFWPTDEDGDGFIDHITVLCRAGLQIDEVESLRRLLRLKQRGGRPDLLATPVFEGSAEAFPQWSGTATKFVSITPYFPNVHITQGSGRGGLKLQKVILKSLTQIGRLNFDVPPKIRQIVAAANVPTELIQDCCFAALPAFPKGIIFPANRPLPPGGDFLMAVGSGQNTIRPLDFCRRRKGVTVMTTGRYLQIEFSTPQPRRPFAVGEQAHFGFGLFVPSP